MADLQKIVYLTDAQYADLIANGSITVGTTTINYSANDLYLTPSNSGNVPNGGTQGQALLKASSTDQDTVWGNVVHPTDIATLNTVGVVKANKAMGTSVDANGNLSVEIANSNEINQRSSAIKVISTGNLNTAVTAALTDANHITLTDAEKATACSTIGALKHLQISCGNSTAVSQALSSGSYYDLGYRYMTTITLGTSVSKSDLASIMGSITLYTTLISSQSYGYFVLDSAFFNYPTANTRTICMGTLKSDTSNNAEPALIEIGASSTITQIYLYSIRNSGTALGYSVNFDLIK